MNQTQLNIIKLIQRSPSTDGWYPISEAVFSGLIERHLPDELWESKIEGGERFLKLTSEGKTLVKFL